MTSQANNSDDLFENHKADENSIDIQGDDEETAQIEETSYKPSKPVPKTSRLKSTADSKKKKSTLFPTPPNPESFESYGFGSFKNSGGMYIYINGPFTTVSLSQSKYLNSVTEIENQSKTRKKSLTLNISVIRNNKNDSESRKFIKVAFEYKKKEGTIDLETTRVLIAQLFINHNEEIPLQRSVGIIIPLKFYLEIKDFIYSPGTRSLAVEDDTEIDF